MKCPECGYKISQPKKSWEMHQKNPNRISIRVEQYECPNCKHKFRKGVKILKEV